MKGYGKITIDIKINKLKEIEIILNEYLNAIIEMTVSAKKALNSIKKLIELTNEIDKNIKNNNATPK